MNFLRELKRRYLQFIRGRYGHDELTTFLFIVYLVVALLSFFFRRFQTFSFSVQLMLLLVILFRTHSRNYHARKSENDAYLRLKAKVLHRAPKDPYKVFKCPNCQQKVRIPRGRGKVEITCPRCKTKFTKRS